DNDLLQHLAEEMAKVLRQTFGERVLGPDKPVVSRVQSMHIRKIIIKMEMGASPSAVRTALMQAQNYMQSIPVAANLNVYYDVDPQ
ncbi:MAG: primosomal protein N', partial [Bacteroidaceae bacterium]|nr:primosomal protein N' [Bacteroidaceae bacterium]